MDAPETAQNSMLLYAINVALNYAIICMCMHVCGNGSHTVFASFSVRWNKVPNKENLGSFDLL